MAMSPCHQLREAGTSVWLDQLSRELVQSGKLKELISSAALGGVTSNPSIFHQAMTQGRQNQRSVPKRAARFPLIMKAPALVKLILAAK